MTIILGIDPGTARTGYGFIAFEQGQLRPIDYGIITTTTQESPAQRLQKIHGRLQVLIHKYGPEVIAVEQLFFNSNTKTALAVGQARGVAILAGAQAGLPIREYTPLQVKQTLTGQGRASKEQVAFMVKTLLKLRILPKPDDVTDALAVAVTHAHMGNTMEKWMARGR